MGNMNEPCNCDGLTIPIASSSSSGILTSTDWVKFNNKVNSDLLINNRPLTDDITITASEIDAIPNSDIGIANGICPLNASGLIATKYLPEDLGIIYKGLWDPSTNTPKLDNSIGNLNELYIISKDGSTSLNNISDWHQGDIIIYLNYQWRRLLSSITFSTLSGIKISNVKPNQILSYKNNTWTNTDQYITKATYNVTTRDELTQTPGFAPICSLKESKFWITIKSSTFSGSVVLEGICSKGDLINDDLPVPITEYQNSETYSFELKYNNITTPISESYSNYGIGPYYNPQKVLFRCTNALYHNTQTKTNTNPPQYQIYDITTAQYQTGYYYGWLPFVLHRKNINVYLAVTTRGDLYLWNKPWQSTNTWNDPNYTTLSFYVTKLNISE